MCDDAGVPTSCDASIVVVGAGPAGLTAAYLLAKRGLRPLVLEADPSYVGGISRTVCYKGYRFDIGGHRFFSRAKDVEDFWTEILPHDMLVRQRSSRIYYQRKFFSYPLKPFQVLRTLGPLEAARCVASYLQAKARPVPNPRNFEDWTINRFGQRLYEIFFKAYTEKLWGMSCRQISADWAAQRVKGLSLASAVMSALRPRRKSGPVITTLIESFRYPRRGPGMLWDACASKIQELGGTLQMGATVTSLEQAQGQWRIHYRTGSGSEEVASADQVISSAPLRDVMLHLFPEPGAEVTKAASALRYRNFLLVALIVRDRKLFSDNWIYIQDPDIKAGRIQNFKAWSPDMVPPGDTACYGMEYFASDDEPLWNMSNAELVALAGLELERLALGHASDLLDACVVRQPKGYPVYDATYASNVAVIRRALAERYPGLHVVGRNGMHRYNNQDHSMMTAMLTVENILSGQAKHDVWCVNQDAEYLEAGAAGTTRLVHDTAAGN
jgi:protoporphyrinogen oxidase